MAGSVTTQKVLRIPPTVFHLDPRLEGATDALLVLQVRGTPSNAMALGQPACRRGDAPQPSAPPASDHSRDPGPSWGAPLRPKAAAPWLTLITGGLTPA
jgi:hypothetical protein